MGVIDKQTFTTEFKDRLATLLTAHDADRVISALVEQMGHFDIERLAEGQGDREFKEMVDVYLNTLTMEGRSKGTIERYRRELLRYHEFDPTPIRHVTVFNIRHYLSAEKERGVADTTLRGIRWVYTSFFGWLHREGILQVDPCANLRPIRTGDEEREPFTDVELEQIKNSCRTEKERAVVHFLLSTGCRIGEVVSLDKGDIDFQHREAKVRGKGNKVRYVYFTDVASMYLQEYLQTRRDDSDALFVSKFRSRMTPSGFQSILKTVGERAGVDNVFPHRFRHTFATNMIHAGMPIQEVSVLLGHSRIDTTAIYAHTSQDRVRLSYLMHS